MIYSWAQRFKNKGFVVYVIVLVVENIKKQCIHVK